MKHSEFEAFIFVGTKKGERKPSVILNNDEDLTVRELDYNAKQHEHELDICLKNIFSIALANNLENGVLSKPLVRTFRVFKGEDWRRDAIYDDEPIEVTFKAVKVNIEASYFSVYGLC